MLVSSRRGSLGGQWRAGREAMSSMANQRVLQRVSLPHAASKHHFDARQFRLYASKLVSWAGRRRAGRVAVARALWEQHHSALVSSCTAMTDVVTAQMIVSEAFVR